MSDFTDMPHYRRSHVGEYTNVGWNWNAQTHAARIAVLYVNQNVYQEETDTVTLLIPDINKENREDFIWCVPIPRDKWNKWYLLAEKFKTTTPQRVRYMNRMEGKEVRTVLILPTAEQSDDDALTACAYLRMVKQLNCRMYIVRCTDDMPSTASIIHQVAGVDPSLVNEIDDDEYSEPTPKEV
jgi:hypothetical protein